MTHSQLVEQKLHEKDLMELLYRGVEPNSVVSDYDPNDYNRLCSMFDFDHSPITVRKPFNGTMEDYVQRATSENGWNMPDEYKDECSIKAYWNYYIGEKHTVANKNEKIYEQKTCTTLNTN